MFSCSRLDSWCPEKMAHDGYSSVTTNKCLETEAAACACICVFLVHSWGRLFTHLCSVQSVQTRLSTELYCGCASGTYQPCSITSAPCPPPSNPSHCISALSCSGCLRHHYSMDFEELSTDLANPPLDASVQWRREEDARSVLPSAVQEWLNKQGHVATQKSVDCVAQALRLRYGQWKFRRCPPCVPLSSENVCLNVSTLSQRGAWCAVCLVCTQIMLPLNVAEKWTVGTECNGLVLLFVCMGKTCLGGIIWGGGTGHNGCMCMHNSFPV